MTQETQKLKFAAALLDSGWASDVVVEVDGHGWITDIATDISTDATAKDFEAVALPGMINVHSHAFQRAFAGLSEYRTGDRDSFWTWRKLMYDFLQQLTPDDIYTIAKQLYLEMLMAGYTWVGEFQYLHNAPDGRLYEDPTEISRALIRAARETGIGICLLPVLYQRGGFDNSSLRGGQKRFGLSNEQFLDLFNRLNADRDENCQVGFALHSLRAVSIENAKTVLECLQQSSPESRVHVHVSEQNKEVEDCLAATGQRPVDYLVNHFSVDDKWCLVHATHLSPSELAAIATSRAIVGLCPTTEANLGDGIFSAKPFLDLDGRISIGSDSHCSVDFREELRLLEYGQRLTHQERAVLGTEQLSVGRRLFEMTGQGGAQAIGVKTGKITTGYRADLLLVDPRHPAIAGATEDRLLDRQIFCNADDPTIGTMVGGNLCTIDDPEFADRVGQSQSDFLKLTKRLIN